MALAPWHTPGVVAADGCVVAGVVLTAVAVVVAIVYGTWQVAQASQARKDREADRIAGDTARAEERAAAEEERKGLARAVLDATIIALSGELHPAPAGVALAEQRWTFARRMPTCGCTRSS